MTEIQNQDVGRAELLPMTLKEILDCLFQVMIALGISWLGMDPSNPFICGRIVSSSVCQIFLWTCPWIKGPRKYLKEYLLMTSAKTLLLIKVNIPMFWELGCWHNFLKSNIQLNAMC